MDSEDMALRWFKNVINYYWAININNPSKINIQHDTSTSNRTWYYSLYSFKTIFNIKTETTK